MRGRFLAVAAVLLLPGSLVAGRSCACDPIMVAAAYPTNGQETLPDLSDPGLEGGIRLRVPLGRRHLRRLRRGHPYEGAYITLLSGDFVRVPLETVYDRGTGTLSLLPQLPMADGQYTLRVKGALFERRRLRRREDHSYADFHSSFTVGPDVHAPRVRDAGPAANQSEVGLHFPVTLLFNESLDPESAILGTTVLVEDVGAVPPVPVAGTLSLRNDGFRLGFTPDPILGFPAATRIRVTIRGGGSGPVLLDRAGNALEEEFVLEFVTRD